MVLNDREDSSTTLNLPPLGRVLVFAVLLCFLSFATRQLNLASWGSSGVTILWPSNGFLLGVLLCNRKRHWPAYIVIAYLIDFVINLSLENPPHVSAYISVCNMIEAVLPAFLLYPVIAPKPDLTQRKQLLAFLSIAVLMAPVIASVMASFIKDAHVSVPTFHDFYRWFTADALGMAIVTPLYLAYHQRKNFKNRSAREIVALFALLVAMTVAVFSQTEYPLLFVMLPVLLLLGVRLGLAGSALGLLVLSIVGGFLTTSGHGPVNLMQGQGLSARDLVFQGFIATCMLLLYIVEVLNTESWHYQLDLQGSERRFRLLAEASCDIISLTDLEGRRNYVSPSVVRVLGYQPEQVLGDKYKELLHADDVLAMQALLTQCRNGAPTRSLEFRCRKADGSYIWLETNPRIYNDPDSGEPLGFVSVTRDISLRKAEEEEQQRAFETIEQMASSDALTGIANRRHFDIFLEKEWMRAARDQTCISVLLIDVDRFKAYNDYYGHINGDECLRQVVSALRSVVTRATDLLARYGGEEFVVVLPSTDATGASQMAEWIRLAVEQRRLPHPGNPPHSVITLSIGCATFIPHPQITHLHLLESADRALYRAKSSGRNRIQLSDGLPETGPMLLTG